MTSLEYDRTIEYLETANDWVSEGVLAGKMIATETPKTKIREVLEQLKRTTNIGISRDRGETLYCWYARKEPFDTINQKAIDEWED